MVNVLVQIAFEDYARWEAAFKEAAGLRKSYSSQGVHIFRPVDRQNEAIILGVYEDPGKARQLFQSKEFRDAIKRAGVSAPPVVTYLDEVEQLPA